MTEAKQLRSDLLDIVRPDDNQTYRAFNPLAVTYFKCAHEGRLLLEFSILVPHSIVFLRSSCMHV